MLSGGKAVHSPAQRMGWMRLTVLQEQRPYEETLPPAPSGSSVSPSPAAAPTGLTASRTASQSAAGAAQGLPGQLRSRRAGAVPRRGGAMRRRVVRAALPPAACPAAAQQHERSTTRELLLDQKCLATELLVRILSNPRTD